MDDDRQEEAGGDHADAADDQRALLPAHPRGREPGQPGDQGEHPDPAPAGERGEQAGDSEPGATRDRQGGGRGRRTRRTSSGGPVPARRRARPSPTRRPPARGPRRRRFPTTPTGALRESASRSLWARETRLRLRAGHRSARRSPRCRGSSALPSVAWTRCGRRTRGRTRTMHDMTRWARLGAVAGVTLLAAGCSAAGENADKAGGSGEPVVLTLATVNGDLGLHPAGRGLRRRRRRALAGESAGQRGLRGRPLRAGLREAGGRGRRRRSVRPRRRRHPGLRHPRESPASGP